MTVSLTTTAGALSPSYGGRLIALCGHIGAGKSTVARALEYHGYTRTRFAEPIKQMCYMLGLSEAEVDGHLKEQPCAVLGGSTPRQLQRVLGTEVGRAVYADVWVDFWERKVRPILSGGGRVIVDDMRFPNEVRKVESLGGTLVRVARPGVVAASDHPSDRYVDEIVTHVTLANDSTIRVLGARVECMLEDLLGG